MRILLTNDDGISAPGLAVAEEIAAALAGEMGEVWTVAPAFEQSGVAHCVSYVRPMRLERLGPRRFAVEGSPADCVLAGLHEILKDTPPDLVLSGVNRGHNVAEDTLYSGTVGGAMEGALHGVRIRRPLPVPRPRHRRRRPLRPRPRPRRRAPAQAPRHASPRPRLLRRLPQRQLPRRPGGRGARHPRHLPGPPPRPHLRRPAAHRPERPHLPLAHPRPRQRRQPARLGLRANATTAGSP